MTATNRSYPDISFVETDTEAIVNALIQSYEKFTGRTLYPADPARLFILWVADIIVQERVNIDFSAKQNVPRYAEGEYLDSLAELFKDTYRLEPEKAKTTLRYTLSIKLDTATVIPAGTRATPDGDVVFATLQDLTIPAGQLSGDVAAECTQAGEIGNGFVPGQIKQAVDVFPYFQSVSNTTESAGGADEESDAAFYERLRESVETYSTAGPMGGYEYFAKSASALIADVKATSPEPGEVDVRVLLAGGELPEEEILKEVSEILNADTVRPLTDHVTVKAPETVAYNIDVTYYTQEGRRNQRRRDFGERKRGGGRVQEMAGGVEGAGREPVLFDSTAYASRGKAGGGPRPGFCDGERQSGCETRNDHRYERGCGK